MQVSEFKEQLLYATGTKPDRVLEFSCGKYRYLLTTLAKLQWLQTWVFLYSCVFMLKLMLLSLQFSVCIVSF